MIRKNYPLVASTPYKRFEDVVAVAQWYNPRTLLPELSGGQGSIRGRV